MFAKTTNKQRNKVSRQKRLGVKRGGDEPKLMNRTFVQDVSLYLLFGLLAVFISFFGLSPAGPMVQSDQMARIRVAADIAFDYISRIETERRMESVRQRVPPVFRLEMTQFNAFHAHLNDLFADLAAFASVPENTPIEATRLRINEVESFLEQHPGGNPFGLRATDLLTFYNQLGLERGQSMITEGLIILGEIYRKGIYQPDPAFNIDGSTRLSLFTIEDEFGNIQEVQILSEEESLRTLRIQLAALDIPRESTIALFRMLRSGMIPNLQFDEQRTLERVQQAQLAVEPVRIHVAQGQTIIEPDSRVTALQIEQLEAYRRALREHEAKHWGFSSLFFEQALLSIFIVLGAILFLKASRNRVHRNLRTFILSGGMILFNLLIIRLTVEVGDRVLAETNPIFMQIMPFIAPIIIGPVFITILVGVGPGILAAGVVSVFHAMMQGNSLSILLISQLVGLVAIYNCRNIQLRASLVRAGLNAGLAMAGAVLLLALRDQTDVVTTVYRMLAGLTAGILSGVLIVGLLPVFEHLFKYTSDITLLELTDFNHRLLRKLQVEAPGSYHHSLMVANLAENAAARIGANPLLCRVCALFHDIGKMTKPEYFAENQLTGYNPHIERNPSMSALVIKSHVKEGVTMAKEYRLPKVISDVIQQHHGTSLIQYFYYKALEIQKNEGIIESIYPNAPRIELDKVNEATYRYEGPIPQFTESALIMLADGVEAASRSLKKVTPQSVEELIDKIFLDRLTDGQLDGSPMTFLQLQQVKESFVFTVLNMLHARVEYPKGEDGADKKRLRRNTLSTEPPFARPPDGSPA